MFRSYLEGDNHFFEVSMWLFSPQFLVQRMNRNIIPQILYLYDRQQPGSLHHSEKDRNRRDFKIARPGARLSEAQNKRIRATVLRDRGTQAGSSGGSAGWRDLSD